MCGIAGNLHWGDDDRSGLVKRMCDKMIHRGPDDSGVLDLPEISLGHRRLSIIDLSANARQPMVCENQRFYITFNGEVYNFGVIKKELQTAGYVFRTASDTEVILHAYSHWKEKCLGKFNGMFALAIWDAEKHELFLARDRFGKKPLYYTFNRHRGVTFASTLAALLVDEEIGSRVSVEALNCYLALGYILAPRTIYEGVQKLEPASYLIVSDKGNKIVKEPYWDYAEYFRKKTTESEEDIKEHLVHLVEESVKLRMISDVPVGAFLSGGIDSSSIVSLMKRYHKGELHTFSIGFEQGSYNELHDADKMAAFLGTKHHGETIRAEEVREFITRSIDAFDEPFADNSLIPMFSVSELASKNVTVVLSGDGADELFAGYVTYKADKYHRWMKGVPGILKRGIFLAVKNRNAVSDQKINFSYKLRQFMQGAVTDYERAHYSWRLIFPPNERVAILGAQYRDLIYDTDPFKSFEKYYNRASDLNWLDKSLYVDGMTWLPDDILVKVDTTTMAHSIEARAPYLDVNLAEYAASIPASYKMKGFETKYILKKALKGILPNEVLYKKKSGFNAPVSKWIEMTDSDEFRGFNRFVFEHKNLSPVNLPANDKKEPLKIN